MKTTRHLGYYLAPTVLILLTACGAGFAQEDVKESEDTKESMKYTSIQNLPDNVTLATLENGLTVIVQENHVAQVATVRCYVDKTGSIYEAEHLGAGLSHVLEHVVSGGTTTKRTEKEIEKIIDRFGGATNAYTSSSRTVYFIDCASKDTLMAVDLIADAMQNIVFEPTEFERELRVVRRELADGKVNRLRVKWKMLGQTMYKKHPMRHPVIGYLDVLNRTSNEVIEAFYRERYVPNNQIFVVCGDIDTQEILDKVAAEYANSPHGPVTYIPLPDEPEQMTPRSAHREMEGATFDAILAWPTVKLSHPDLYALDVASYILTEGESSRLARKLKYEKPLVLAIDSASYTPSVVRGSFAVLFTAANGENYLEAKQDVLDAVYSLQTDLIGEAELAKAKKQKSAELVFEAQTVQEAAENLGQNFMSTADPLYSKKYVEGIEQVTAEQIREVARKYFVPQKLNTIVIAPPGGLEEAEQEESKGDAGEAKLVRLDNGLRVLIKRHSHLPMVNIQAYVLGGNLADTTETAGRSAMLAAMLDKGTDTRSAREIAEYFDSIGGKIGMSAGRFTLYGSATVLKEDYPKALGIFADCFTKPALPKDELEKIRTRMLGAIAARAGNPHAEIVDLFYNALPVDSPYHVLTGGTRESVEKLTADDLKAYRERYFVPGQMVVTVYGDIDPDEALKLVKERFGEKLAADSSSSTVSFDRSNALPEMIERHKKIAKETGMVLLGYTTPSIFEKKDYAAMTVLDAMMSGYSYPGGWLHNELRGEGLVYFVHAFQITGPAPGYFAILSQTDPLKTGEVTERIRKNIARAKAGDFTDEEIETAIEMITSLHAQDNTTIGSQASQAALDELYGLGYTYDKGFDKRIQAVTREAMVRAANKYFGNFVLATASPAVEESDEIETTE